MSDDSILTTDVTTPQDAPRRMTRAEASRRNGARSRGPKTEQGKLRSSRNAWKHGLTAKNTSISNPAADPCAPYSDALFYNEDQQVFAAIFAMCMQELSPTDRFEREIVHEIALVRFQTRRGYVIESRLFNRAMIEDSTDFDAEMELDGATEDERVAAAIENVPGFQRSIELIRRYKAQTSRTFRGLMSELRKYRESKNGPYGGGGEDCSSDHASSWSMEPGNHSNAEALSTWTSGTATSSDVLAFAPTVSFTAATSLAGRLGRRRLLTSRNEPEADVANFAVPLAMAAKAGTYGDTAGPDHVVSTAGKARNEPEGIQARVASRNGYVARTGGLACGTVPAGQVNRCHAPLPLALKQQSEPGSKQNTVISAVRRDSARKYQGNGDRKAIKGRAVKNVSRSAGPSTPFIGTKIPFGASCCRPAESAQGNKTLPANNPEFFGSQAELSHTTCHSGLTSAASAWVSRCRTGSDAVGELKQAPGKFLIMQPNSVDPAFEDQATTTEETSFGDILTQFEQEHAEHSDSHGQPIEGTVVVVRDDLVFVDIGRKTEGVVPVESLRDDQGNVTVQTGDKMLVNITGRDEQGNYTLSTIRVERPKDWSGLQEAFAEGRIVGGVVQEVVKGGLRVDIGARAFMPASRSGARDIAEMEKLVGQEIRCKITKLDTEKEDVVVDRRVVLEAEEKERREKAFQAISEGQVLNGTVKTLMDFGAFIDLGGVDGLLHVADMSWTRVNKPSDVLKAGDQVEVKVLKVNPETRKISLGMKQLQPDPWTLAAERFTVGERVKGTVARLADFGAFVNLAPGVDGLIHVSEMSWSRKVRKPSDVVKVGDQVEVVVLGVNPAEKRISLGLKQALGDPWEDAQTKYPVGSVVEAPITNLANFGVFVDLGDGIEGMIHVGDITREKRIDHPKELLKAGQIVKAQVLEFDRERRRIRLGMKQLEPTSFDLWATEHQVGETITARVVEVKGDRLKAELADGVFGIAKVPGAEGGQDAGKGSGAGGSRVDLSAMTEMLKQRWKSGPDFKQEEAVVRSGQVRQFKIASVDTQSKRINLELVV